MTGSSSKSLNILHDSSPCCHIVNYYIKSIVFGMYFIEGSNFNRGQKYFSGGQKYLSGGQKYFIEGSNFIGGSEIL